MVEVEDIASLNQRGADDFRSHYDRCLAKWITSSGGLRDEKYFIQGRKSAVPRVWWLESSRADCLRKLPATNCFVTSRDASGPISIGRKDTHGAKSRYLSTTVSIPWNDS